MNRGWWILKGLKFVVFVTLLIAAFGWVVMTLWNCLLPQIFGLPALHYWQALGLLFLSRILFGGGRGFGGAHSWKHRMHERWHQMTPEQRAKFRSSMRDRWCPKQQEYDEAHRQPPQDRPG